MMITYETMLEFQPFVQILLRNDYRIRVLEEQEYSETDAHFRKGFIAYDDTDLGEQYIHHSRRIYATDYLNNCFGGVCFLRKQDLFRTKKIFDREPTLNNIEMNGLWLSPTLPERVRLAFWIKVVENLLVYPSMAEVFFSYSLGKRGLDNFYRSFAFHTHFEGEIKPIEGMKQEIVKERLASFTIAEMEENAMKLLGARIAKVIGDR